MTRTTTESSRDEGRAAVSFGPGPQGVALVALYPPLQLALPAPRD